MREISEERIKKIRKTLSDNEVNLKYNRKVVSGLKKDCEKLGVNHNRISSEIKKLEKEVLNEQKRLERLVEEAEAIIEENK